MSENTQQSVVEIIQESRFENMGREDKIRHILDHVMEGSIIILEKGLSPMDQSYLVERALEQAGPDFAGIEIDTIKKETNSGLFDKFIGNNDDGESITIVGPEDKLEKFEKGEGQLRTFINMGG